MHLIATAGCPSVVLFSRRFRSGPLCAPRWTRRFPVRVLRRDDLAALPPEEVVAALEAALQRRLLDLGHPKAWTASTHPTAKALAPV